MNVKEIIEKYLKDNKYEGLCCDGCGCGIDDIAPCCSSITECIPAYRHKCECGNFFYNTEVEKNLIFVKNVYNLSKKGEKLNE